MLVYVYSIELWNIFIKKHVAIIVIIIIAIIIVIIIFSMSITFFPPTIKERYLRNLRWIESCKKTFMILNGRPDNRIVF